MSALLGRSSGRCRAGLEVLELVAQPCKSIAQIRMARLRLQTLSSYAQLRPATEAKPARENNNDRVARRTVSKPARVRHPGAHQPQSQQLGLSDRRLRDRDDVGSQPRRARRLRVSAAGLARRVERRLQPDFLRQEAAHPGAVLGGRRARGVRAGWRRHRRGGDARVRQRDDFEFRRASWAGKNRRSFG